MTPVLPIVGSAGFYDLAPPFNTKTVNNVEYTCKAIRRISDYLANNEEVKGDVYDENGLSEEIYTEDLKEDAYIVSLQSRTGHWLYIPYRYILSYPSMDGIPYRSMMLGFSLPSLPLAQNLDVLQSDIKDLIDSRLGIACVAKSVETSKIVLISSENHETLKIKRTLAQVNSSTLTATIQQLQKENALLRTKVTSLESMLTAP